MHCPVLLCVVLAGCFGFAKPAHADPSPSEASPPTAPSTPTFIDVAFDIGGVSSSSQSYEGGPEIGVTLLLRRWMLEAGPTLNGAAHAPRPVSQERSTQNEPS